MSQENKSSERKQVITPEQINKLQELAAQIQYGSLTLVFQQGKLIQIDRSEKIRITEK